MVDCIKIDSCSDVNWALETRIPSLFTMPWRWSGYDDIIEDTSCLYTCTCVYVYVCQPWSVCVCVYASVCVCASIIMVCGGDGLWPDLIRTRSNQWALMDIYPHTCFDIYSITKYPAWPCMSQYYLIWIIRGHSGWLVKFPLKCLLKLKDTEDGPFYIYWSKILPE